MKKGKRHLKYTVHPVKESVTKVYLGLGVVGTRINSCKVVEIRLELRATIPWRMTGCCGMSMSTRPTVSSPVLCLPARLVTDEYRPCDFPIFTLTTIL